MQDNVPEEMARALIEECADCDICRFLMEDTPCLVFPELYRLHDKEKEENEPITPELRTAFSRLIGSFGTISSIA